MIWDDHIVEQHVHNMDTANWHLQAHPLYNPTMKPSADDFEKGGEIEMPKDGDIRIPGRA